MGQLAEQDPEHQAEAHRLAERLIADLLTDERCDVADQQVLDGEEPIQRPDVHVLPAEPAMPPLGGRQPRPRRQLEIGIEADDVGVAVMQDVVLDPPQPGAGAERVGRVGERLVDPPVTRERAVIGVVHDARPDGDQRQRQDRRRTRPDHERELRDDERVVARDQAGRGS